MKANAKKQIINMVEAIKENIPCPEISNSFFTLGQSLYFFKIEDKDYFQRRTYTWEDFDDFKKEAAEICLMMQEFIIKFC